MHLISNVHFRMCICTLYLKFILNIFENVKKSKTKCRVNIFTSYVPTKLFQHKTTFCAACVKRQNLGLK